jgi:hypothetical protein
MICLMAGNSRGLIVRGLLVALALVAALWFAVGIRQARDTDRAGAIVSSAANLSRAQARHANSLLDGAAELNPDTQVQILRSEVALGRGQLALARRIAAEVTRSEPLNSLGWLLLARVSNGPAVTAALHHLGELVPRVPGGS